MDTIVGWVPDEETPCHAARNIDDAWYAPEVSGTRPDVGLARALCRPCPYRVECLGEAMRFEAGQAFAYRHGVWGGYTAMERAQLAAVAA